VIVMSTQHNHEPTPAERSNRALVGVCFLLAVEVIVAGVLALLWREERLPSGRVNSLRSLVEAAPRGEPADWPPTDEECEPAVPLEINNTNVDFVEDIRIFDFRRWVVRKAGGKDERVVGEAEGKDKRVDGEAERKDKRVVRLVRKVLIHKTGHAETLTFEAYSGEPLRGEFIGAMSDKKASLGRARTYKTGKGSGLNYVAQVKVDISTVAAEGEKEITVCFSYSGDFDGSKGSWAGALIKDKSLRECTLLIIAPPDRPFKGIKGGRFQPPDPIDTAKTYGKPVQDPFGGWAALEVPSPQLDQVYLLQWDPWK
jgi:hypothetical protein